MMFIIAACLAIAIAIIVVASYYQLAKTKKLLYISTDSRQMYVDLGKSLLTSAGIASSIMVGTYSRSQIPAWMVGHALMFLVACIVLSVAFMLAISRFYETAISRQSGRQPAPLKKSELIVVFILGAL